MVQRLLDGDRRKDRMGRIEKRPTRGRQPYAVNFVHAPAAQALMHRVVLAVDGEQRLALAASLGCDQLPPAAPCPTSISPNPSFFRRTRSASASDSAAIDITRGRQRRAWSTAASRFDPAANATI